MKKARGVAKRIPNISKKDEKRFWSFVSKGSDCWVWVSCKTGSGYGRFNMNDNEYRSHRVSMKLSGITVPTDMVVDHICKNRLCVNPDHLKLVTPGENTLENSSSPSALNMKKTLCKRGHKFESKTYLTPCDQRERRVCIECRKIRYWLEKALAAVEKLE